MDKLVYKDRTDIVCLERAGVKIIKHLTIFRSNLIASRFSLRLAEEVLGQLAEEFSEYDDLCPKEYCSAIYTVLRHCPDKDAPNLEHFINDSQLLLNF